MGTGEDVKIAMAAFQDTNYQGQRVELDGNEYRRCVFRECVLVYKGGPLPFLSESVFYTCQFAFEDAAERTLQFMRAIAVMMGRDGLTMIEKTFPEVFHNR
jgi:hypothetical protein